MGYGASGRNGSFAMTVVGLGFGVMALLKGKQFVKDAHLYMERAVDGLESARSTNTASTATCTRPASCGWRRPTATSSASSTTFISCRAWASKASSGSTGTRRARRSTPNSISARCGNRDSLPRQPGQARARGEAAGAAARRGSLRAHPGHRNPAGARFALKTPGRNRHRREARLRHQRLLTSISRAWRKQVTGVDVHGRHRAAARRHFAEMRLAGAQRRRGRAQPDPLLPHHPR